MAADRMELLRTHGEAGYRLARAIAGSDDAAERLVQTTVEQCTGDEDRLSFLLMIQSTARAENLAPPERPALVNIDGDVRLEELGERFSSLSARDREVVLGALLGTSHDVSEEQLAESLVRLRDAITPSYQIGPEDIP